MKKMIIAAFAVLITTMTMAQNIEDFRQPYPSGQKLPSTPNFTGDVWLAPVSTNDSLNLPASNVTFAPSCINSWHYHTGGQVLVASVTIKRKGNLPGGCFPVTS